MHELHEKRHKKERTAAGGKHGANHQRDGGRTGDGVEHGRAKAGIRQSGKKERSKGCSF